MSHVVVAAKAATDMRQILTYLAREAGAQVAGAYAERFIRRIDALGKTPEIGVPRPALGRTTRALIVFPYIIVYEYVDSDDMVTVLVFCTAGGTSRASFFVDTPLGHASAANSL